MSVSRRNVLKVAAFGVGATAVGMTVPLGGSVTASDWISTSAKPGRFKRPLPVPQSEGQLDLAVHVQQSRDSLAVEFRYDTALFEPATVHRLARQYRRLLSVATAEPDRSVLRTPLLDPAELTDLMEGRTS